MVTTIDMTNLEDFVYNEDFVSTGYLSIYGMTKHVSIYQKTLLDNLVAKLNKSSSQTVVLFIPGVLFGIFISVAIGLLIYRVLWAERKYDSKVLGILPLSLVMNNRHMKAYLLKESTKFYKLVKRYDKLALSDNRLEYKIKNINK